MVDRIWPCPHNTLKLRRFLSTTFGGMVDRRRLTLADDRWLRALHGEEERS